MIGWNSTFYVFGAVYLLGALAWLRVDASRPMPLAGSQNPRYYLSNDVA
jgi:hypothetical protein